MVLLVDGDIRRPTLHTYLDLPNEKGLTDYLIGNLTFEDVVRVVPNTTAKVVTGGRPSPNPTELLSSERFREFLDKALAEYDRIVIDVAPVLYIPDGLIVAKYVHSGVLICGSGMVDKKAVKIVKDKFDSVGHSFIGMIVNRADYAKEGYRYKYLYAYKNYYTKGVSESGLKA
jgi:tyrosine-protein kinase Etk/Wzc